jgi:hypothetical protein
MGSGIIFKFLVMDETIFETVLSEVLEELRQANVSLREMKGLVSGLEERVGVFERQLREQTVVAPPADVEPVKEVVAGGLELLRGEQSAGMQRIAAILEGQPKNVVKQWRVSFFPDNGRMDYGLLVRKLAFVAILGMVVTSLFVWGCRWLDRYYAYREVSEKAVVATPRKTVGGAPGQNGRGPERTVGLPGSSRTRKERRRNDTLNKKYIRIFADSLGDSAR